MVIARLLSDQISGYFGLLGLMHKVNHPKGSPWVLRIFTETQVKEIDRVLNHGKQ